MKTTLYKQILISITILIIHTYPLESGGVASTLRNWITPEETQHEKVDLSYTNITDETLDLILQKVGHSLRILNLKGCKKLQNPIFFFCRNLQNLDLSFTDITDETLDLILQNVGHSLRILNLKKCKKLQ